MRFPRWMILVVLAGCGDAGSDGGGQAGQGGDDRQADAGRAQGGQGGDRSHADAGHPQGGHGGSGSKPLLQVPRIYPLVRAGTPTGLIADPADRNPGDPSLGIIDEDAGMQGAGSEDNSLAQTVQDRLYSPGPTALLRIVRELDGRTAQLDTDPAKHACLGTVPVARTWTFPSGQSFNVQLQCMQEWTGGWLAFGFAPSEPDGDDAGAAGAAAGGNDFFLVQGQEGGMGGAYRVRAGSGDVEAWITVADHRAPNNSQVVMHLLVDAAASTTELAFGGSGVGFCSAHLKTGDNYLFIRGKPNAPPPPGAPNGHYCGSERTGCFATTELNVNLGAAANGCRPIASASFGILGTLDASGDPEGNVTPLMIYQFFDTKPQGIPAY
jgi:hypothetical protein